MSRPRGRNLLRMAIVTTMSVCSFTFVRKSAVIDVVVVVKPPIMILLSPIWGNITFAITGLVISNALSSGLTEPGTTHTILAQAHR